MTTNMSSQSLYDFSMKGIDGDSIDLADYSGKVVLIVNVASFCGFTPQYTPLEELYQKYKDRGFVILGMPANDFGAQEPGTDAEIQQFCKEEYRVTFPMFSRIVVKGPDKVPLFDWLTSGNGANSPSGEIRWNFEKFLIGKDGAIVARFKTDIEPLSEKVVAAVEAAIDA